MGFLSFLCLAGGVSISHGQATPDLATVLTNTTLLKTEILLNKETYLLGEEMEVRLQATNPTNRSLIVLAPFATSHHGKVRIVDLDEDGEMRFGQDHDPPFGPETPAPWETFAPGEVKSLAFRSSDDLAIKSMASRWDPGRYGVYYAYGATFNRFRLVRPDFEQIAEARHPVDYVSPGDALGTPSRVVPVFQYAFSLRRDGISYLCATRGVRSPLKQISRGGPAFAAGPLHRQHVPNIGPYKIVGTSAAPVTSLQVAVDSAENVTITYATSSGGAGTRIDLDRNLNRR